MITVGAGEIADPLAELTAKCTRSSGTATAAPGIPQQPNLIQSGDDGSEISYSAGVATGLLMKAKGGDQGGDDRQQQLQLREGGVQGLPARPRPVDPSYEWTYVATGSFNDAAAATEAFNNLKAQGVGGDLPVPRRGPRGGRQAGQREQHHHDERRLANACERTDLKYDIAVKLNTADYLSRRSSQEMQAGSSKRGKTRVFHVGVDPQRRCQICKPTAEQTSRRSSSGLQGDRRRRLQGPVRQDQEGRLQLLMCVPRPRRPVLAVRSLALARSRHNWRPVTAQGDPGGGVAVCLEGITKRYGHVVAWIALSGHGSPVRGVRVSERQRANGQDRPAWPGNAHQEL